MDREHQKPISAIRRKLRGTENLQCPPYKPRLVALDSPHAESGMVGGIRSRVDIEYARLLIGSNPTVQDEKAFDVDGWCHVPKVDLYVSGSDYFACRSSVIQVCLQSYDFVMAAAGKQVPEDMNPTSEKLLTVSDGYILQNVTGIRAHVVSRLDGRGYDITKRECAC